MAPGEAEGDAPEVLTKMLRGVAPQHVAVLCIGNPTRGDDGFGPAVAAELPPGAPFHVFDGGQVPENDLPRIAALEPEVVVLVDAVHFDAPPGTLRALPVHGLRQDDVSTHAGSLSVVAEWLEQACGARVLLLAAQPAQTNPGEGPSPRIEAAARQAARLLSRTVGAGTEEA